MQQQQMPASVPTRKWAAGPWDNEEDFWQGSILGFRVEIVRMPHMGHLCGYIYVPKEHALFGKDFDEPQVIQLNVHGGITFCDDRDEKGWALGFDCAHAEDIVPLMEGLRQRYDLTGQLDAFGVSDYLPMEASLGHRTTYKDMDFVRAQLCRLAEQL